VLTPVLALIGMTGSAAGFPVPSTALRSQSSAGFRHGAFTPARRSRERLAATHAATVYNAQAVATTAQIIIAADITQQSNDSGQLEPMISQAVTTLHAAGVDDQALTVLADDGYWNSPQITQLGQDGIAAIVPTKAATRTKARELLPSQGPEAEPSTRWIHPRAPRSTADDNT
jgi:hypothetical protein